MKVSGIKYYKDESSFKKMEALGLNVEKVVDAENIDERIESLIKLNYKMIIITNELAGFSQNIIKKYNNHKGINIIITKNKKEV